MYFIEHDAQSTVEDFIDFMAAAEKTYGIHIKRATINEPPIFKDYDDFIK